MLKDIKRHKLDYSLLSALALSFGAYFVLERHNPTLLVGATLVFALLYVLWGIWHHSRAGHLTGKLVLEYLLVSLSGVMIVSTLLL